MIHSMKNLQDCIITVGDRVEDTENVPKRYGIVQMFKVSPGFGATALVFFDAVVYRPKYHDWVSIHRLRRPSAQHAGHGSQRQRAVRK